MKDKVQEMIPVPLPTEVPHPPSLDSIPLDILHSATVEMLIQQNEDLSSRLKVNIRRNSQLEQQILENKKEIQHLEQQKASLKAQNEIIQEKEKIWSAQKESSNRRLETQNKEISLLEQRYTELFSSSQQRGKSQQKLLSDKQNELEQLQEKLKVLHQVRRRAKEKLRQFLLDMAMGFTRSQKGVRQQESSNRLLKKNYEILKNEIDEKQSFFTEQLENLKDASAKKIRELDLQLAALDERNRLLEQEKKDLGHEYRALEVKLHEEKKNRIKLSEAYEQIDKLRNENIKQKRILQSHNDKLENSLQMASQTQRKLKESKELLEKQFSEQQAALTSCEKELVKLAKDNKEMAMQMDSLKKLWLDTQARLEKEEMKNSTLEKINRELSQSHHDDKIQRATQSAAPAEPEQKQERLQRAYASQYRSMKNMDL